MELSGNISTRGPSAHPTKSPGSSVDETSTTSFLVSLGINGLIAVVVLLLFSTLRTKLKHIYSPRLLLLEARFPLGKLPRSFLAWFIPALMAKDDDVFRYAGIDALVYMRFIRLCVKISLVIMPYGLAVLLPLNLYGGVDLSGLSKLTMSNLLEDSQKMWAHFVAVWVYTLVICYMLYEEWRVFVVYRQEYLAKGLYHQYAVLVRDLPTRLRKEESMKSYMEELFPDQIEDVAMVEDLRRWEKIISVHDDLVLKLEKAKFILEKTGERPSHRSRRGHLIGDSIVYYEKKIENLQVELEEEMHREHTVLPCSFVIFKSLKFATESLLKKSTLRKRGHPMPAPGANDVIWSNLIQLPAKRRFRSLIIALIVILTIFFYFIPVGFVSSLIALQNLEKKFPFLSKVHRLPAVVVSFIEGFLSGLALLIFFAILPVFMRFLSSHQGFVSMSHAEISTLKKLFIFKVVNQFLFLTAGSALNKLEDMTKNPQFIPTYLGTTLPSLSTFFISFLMLCAFTVYPFELLRPVPLALVSLKRKFFTLTPREERESWRPPPAAYDALFADHLLILIIGLCYSVMAPLVSPFVLLYFVFGYVVWMYQLLCVYIPTYSTGGMMWPVVFNGIIACLIVFHLVMIGIFGLKRIVVMPILLAPLPFLTFAFLVCMKRLFFKSYNFLSNEISDTLPEASPRILETVAQTYIRNHKLPDLNGLSTDGTSRKIIGYEEIPSPDERSPLLSPVDIQAPDPGHHDNHFRV